MIPMSLFKLAILAATSCVTALGQVQNGSFESAVAGGTVMPAGWSSSVSTGGSATRILPYLSCATDVGFPSDGAKWTRLTSSVMGTLTAFTGVSKIESTFTIGAAGSLLTLDVAFATGENPGDPSWNDFMAVTVTVGATTQTIYLVDTTAGSFPTTMVCSNRPCTGKITLSQNLVTLFPTITTTTPITLRVYVGNGGDTAVPSFGYVDKVTLSSSVVIPPLSLSFLPSGPGNWIMKTNAPALPGAEVFNLVALNLSLPTGSGPLFGIAFDSLVLEQAMSPLGTVPWHVNLDGAGVFQIGPFGIPAGLSVDYIAIAIVGGAVSQVTPASNITF